MLTPSTNAGPGVDGEARLTSNTATARRVLGDVSPNVRNAPEHGLLGGKPSTSNPLKRGLTTAMDSGHGFQYLKRRKLSTESPLCQVENQSDLGSNGCAVSTQGLRDSSSRNQHHVSVGCAKSSPREAHISLSWTYRRYNNYHPQSPTHLLARSLQMTTKIPPPNASHSHHSSITISRRKQRPQASSVKAVFSMGPRTRSSCDYDCEWPCTRSRRTRSGLHLQTCRSSHLMKVALRPRTSLEVTSGPRLNKLCRNCYPLRSFVRHTTALGRSTGLRRAVHHLSHALLLHRCMGRKYRRRQVREAPGWRSRS